ncbi:D-alanine--D-alanine ligase family protein [Caldicellulosiruptoraceae bacterium PP1]
MNKLNIAVLFGGVSTEHEVSIISAKSVIENLDKEKYEIIPVGITKEGKWLLYTGKIEDLNDKWFNMGVECIITPDKTKKALLKIKDSDITYIDIDCVFPVLHGVNGEDGTIQGLLELAGVPYVGCGVLSSAVCMDKAFTKKLALIEGIPQGHFMVLNSFEYEKEQELWIRRIESEFSYPCFIKPSNGGSSVGITKAHNRIELIEGIAMAFMYDTKIVIEEFIDCREVECSVLGLNDPIASTIGEIIPSREFYDYEAKYIDNNSILVIPAKVSEHIVDEIQKLAVKLFKMLDCSGMARVDFFIEKNTEKIYFNEINTIPGFTSISMYPKLWENVGLSYSELLDRLIEIAIERHNQKQRLKYSKEG